MDGKEVFEAEQDIAILFKHFAEVIDPYNPVHEDEAYDLLRELEQGVWTINAVLS